jgi:hypothetical protein
MCPFVVICVKNHFPVIRVSYFVSIYLAVQQKRLTFAAQNKDFRPNVYV